MNSGYPVLLDLTDRHCVIVGAGAVAARKIAGLLEAGARVTVISPQITREMDAYQGRFQWLEQTYSDGMLAALHPLLVFAATSSPETNQQVKSDAQAIGALVNVVDHSTEGDFSNMATVRRPPLTIAFHSGGASPALSRHVRTQIESLIGEEYSILADWLGSLRVEVLEIETQAQRQQLYEALLAADLFALLRRGEIQAARQKFDEVVHQWRGRL